MLVLTRQQRLALKRLWGRPRDMELLELSYKQFRKTVTLYPDGTGCVMVPWCGMWIGIETDGHTHS